MQQVFRHYGDEKYNASKFQQIKNSSWCGGIKPDGGLWSSPVDSDWGWKDWCEAEDFRECTTYFDFMLAAESRIYVIDSYQDLANFRFVSYRHDYPHCRIDFEGASKEYDAILLTDRGERETRMSHPFTLCGWDCATLLVLNKEVICNVENHV